MKINKKVFFFTFLFLIISICTTLAYNPMYYKPIHINNTGGSEQTYYQVSLNVSYDSDMQTDFDDLRVKYYNGVEWVFIPYWIEDKVNNEWCKLLFNATYIPANSWCNNSYRLYYGDNLANSESNGDETFLFFDDFSNSDEWEVSDGINIDTGNKKLIAIDVDRSGDDRGSYKDDIGIDGGNSFKMYGSFKWTENSENCFFSYGIASAKENTNTVNNFIGLSFHGSSSSDTDLALYVKIDDSSSIDYFWNEGSHYNVIYNFVIIKNGNNLEAKVWDSSHSEENPSFTASLTNKDFSGVNFVTWQASNFDTGNSGSKFYFSGDFLNPIFIQKYDSPEPIAQLGEEQATCISPIISDLSNSTPGTTSVTITWTTNQSADNRVKYSKNSDLSNALWSSWDNDTTSVSITLTGLYPNTTYYYQAWSYNSTYSNCYTTDPSSQPYNSFTTLNLSGIEPLYINIEEVREGYVKINASWIGFDAFETSHYFVFCNMSYGKVKSKKTNGDGKLTVEETLHGLFVEGEEYCCKAAAYRGNSSANSVYTDEACFIATSNKTLKQTSYGNYMDNLINISSESNVTTWASLLSEPYKDRMGMTFFGIIFILPFIAMWIRGSNTIIPSILGLILGGFIWAYMPEKFIHMAYLFIIISIAGVVYGIFRQKV